MSWNNENLSFAFLKLTKCPNFLQTNVRKLFGLAIFNCRVDSGWYLEYCDLYRSKTCKRNKFIPTKMYFFQELVTPSYCSIFHEWLWMLLMWENLFHHLHQSVVGGNCLYSSVDHAIGLAVIKISISFFEILFWWVICQSAKFFSKDSDKMLLFVWETKD